MNIWYLFLLLPIGALLLIVVLINTYCAGPGWDEYIKERNNIEVKDKKMRKSKFNQLNEQINKLTKAVEETNNKLQVLQEEIEVYKFKQNVKNGFQFNLGYIPINPYSLDFNTMPCQTAVREDGTVYTSVVGIMNPIIKYVGVKRIVRTNSTGNVEYKDTEQVIEFTNERVVLCDIYNHPTATQVDDSKYVIKLTPGEEYINKENKPQTIYLFVNLAAEKVDYLTLIDCQELGFDINIDKNRKWFEV